MLFDLPNYTISAWWLIAAVFLAFLFGLTTGIRIAKDRITMKLLKKLDVDEFEKLMEDDIDEDGTFSTISS